MEESNELVEKEDARVGYQVAVDLWTYQGQLNWQRYNVMLVANSVIIAVIGAILSGQLAAQRSQPLLMISLAGVGFVLCIAWVLLTARGFDHHRYWILCAWGLEEHLGEAVRAVSKLQSLGAPEGVNLKVRHTENGEDELKTHRFGTFSRVPQGVVAYSVIVVFTGFYVVLIDLSILVLLRVALGVL